MELLAADVFVSVEERRRAAAFWPFLTERVVTARAASCLFDDDDDDDDDDDEDNDEDEDEDEDDEADDEDSE